MRVLLIVALVGVSNFAVADELDNVGALAQSQFRLLAEDLAGVLGYRGLQPAEPYGTIGFDVGIDAGVVRFDNESVWRQAGVDASNVSLLRISANKGLPFGFDVGGFVATAPGAGFRSVGVQLRYALIEGGVAMPALGLRAAVTRLDGVDDLSYSTRSLDLSISKGLGPMTPYGGIGRVWGFADANGLADENVGATRVYTGVKFSFVVLQFVLEAERTGDTTGYGAKLAFGF